MWNSLALLVLRVAAGGMMLFGHGWTKLARFTEVLSTFPDPLGIGPGFSLFLAVFAEVGCAAAVIGGLFTRIAAVPLVVTMGVAVFLVHAADPWAQKELALLYGAAFATLILAGGGDYSLDTLRRRPTRRSRL